MNVKHLAIYYPSLEYFGGIESVVIQQLRIFVAAGYQCHVITDTPIVRCAGEIAANSIVIEQSAQRAAEWQRVIAQHGIEVVLINGAAFPSAASDVEAIHAVGAKVVLTIHFSFPSPMIFNEAWNCYKLNREIGYACDAVVTVSSTDAKWWKALGCNAHYVQNPFVTPEVQETKIVKKNVVVWVGREAPQKKIYEAFRIIAEVKKDIPDVVLRIVGPSNDYAGALRELDIERNVQFYPNEKNVGQHYAAAKVHLLTSITESFCLVIAEAKAYAIPTVMYSIPFLELVKDGRGIIEVEQRDATAAACEIIKMMRNDGYRQQLGLEAKKTLADFNDQALLAGWAHVFDQLSVTMDSSTKCDACDMYIRQIYDAWEYQRSNNQYKIDFFEELDKMTGGHGRSLARFFMQYIVGPLRTIKNKIK